MPPDSPTASRLNMPPLPHEIVYSILNYLPKRDIRRFLWISGSLRAVAARHPRCFFIADVVYPRANFRQELLTKAHLVSHARAHKLHVAVRFDYRPSERHVLDGDGASLLKLVLAIVVDAMPVTVRLSLCVPVSSDEALNRLWAVPAPRLCKFELHYNDPHLGVRPLIATSLFADVAPRLIFVSLAYATLGAQPVAAFTRVRDAQLQNLTYNSKVAIQLPSLKHLELVEVTADEPEIDCSGLTLNSLHASGSVAEFLPLIGFQPDLRNVPSITYYDRADRPDDDRVWHGLYKGPLELQVGRRFIRSMKREAPIVLSLSSVTLPVRRRRTFVPRWGQNVTFFSLLPIASRLARIRMSSESLAAFIRTEVEVPGLRDLQIDLYLSQDAMRPHVLWASLPGSLGYTDSEAETFAETAPFAIKCPRLEAVKLRATIKPALVNAIFVAYIGRSLWQLERAPSDRARLQMTGARFNASDSRVLLESVFSRVEYVDFTPLYDRYEKVEVG